MRSTPRRAHRMVSRTGDKNEIRRGWLQGRHVQAEEQCAGQTQPPTAGLGASAEPESLSGSPLWTEAAWPQDEIIPSGLAGLLKRIQKIILL